MDDNYRVKKGDFLVQLDKEPYQVQVNIKKAAVVAAESGLEAAEAQVRGLVAQPRQPLQARARHRRREQPDRQPPGQRGDAREPRRRPWSWRRSNLKRGEELAASGGISKEELDAAPANGQGR